MSLFLMKKDTAAKHSLRKVFGLFMVMLFMSIPLVAQNLKESQISLKLKNESVVTAFNAISSATNFKFFYDEAVIKNAPRVTIEVTDATIQQVVDQLAKQTSLKFIRSNNTFTVSRGQSKSEPKGVKKVSGVVTDLKGEAVIGATIQVKGTGTGTITDFDGNFALTASSDAILQISYIGYESMEMKVGQESNFRIRLKEDVKVIDEVVVVGYGKQKKVNLTGAVGMVNSEDLNARPIANVTQGLQGMLSGVTIVNSSGQPGEDNTTIRVRGVGTIGNANPLILIDGVEGNLNLLNPEDIESISVLKDAASASIYGARAANGVILVTTKQLSGKEQSPTVNFNGYFGIQTPTRLPKMANAIDFMNWDNEARRNVLASDVWRDTHFQQVLDGSNPNTYADSDWIGGVMRSSAPQQNYNVSVSGRTSLTGYLLSYGYLNQEGLTQGNANSDVRHNIRMKTNAQVANFLTVTSNIGYVSRETHTPVGNQLYQAMRIAPNAPIRYTDGSWAYGGGNTNPVARLHDGGSSSRSWDQISGLFTGKVDIMKGWDVTGTYSFTRDNSLTETLNKVLYFKNPETQRCDTVGNPNSLMNKDVRAIQQSLIVQTNFEFAIGQHKFSGVGGFSQEWNVYREFQASRSNLLTELDPTLNLGSKDGMSNDASASQWAIRSGFGRLSYNLHDRYLVEANLRYDLTSRFAKKNRGGLFPSFSGAWRLSEEPFMKFSREWFENIKLRGSWGILGNQYVGSNNYPYMAIIGSTTGPIIGTNPENSYTQTTLPNPKLTWETIYMTNIGLDLTAFRNRLNFSFDYFNKDTRGILLKLTYPNSLGLSPTEENVGAVNNRGWEIDINWRDKIGQVGYGVGFNLSDVKNQITDLGGLAPSIGDYDIRRVGDPIGAFYGYVAEGLMTPNNFKGYDKNEGRYYDPNIPVIAGPDYQPGDIKYKDISGPEGKPDGRITPEYDRVVIGSPIPRFTYSLRGNADWKGLDFNFTIQGVGKADGYLQGSARHAFQDMAAYPQTIHSDRYNVVSNPNPNASYPRFTYNTDFNQRFSTFWLEDASYLRLKNIQLGYTLPKQWLEKFKISNLRLYCSADNLLTISDFFYAYDPETPVTSGGYYPQVKTVVFGISMTLR